MVKLRKMDSPKTFRALRVVRLALSGAVAGTAIIGILFPHTGLSADAIGAGAGFTAVLLVKATHLI